MTTTPDQRANLLMLSQTPRATISAGERHALAALLADVAELLADRNGLQDLLRATEQRLSAAATRRDAAETKLAATEALLATEQGIGRARYRQRDERQAYGR